MEKSEKPNHRRIIITVEEIRGECPIYQVGDKIIIEDFYVKANESKDTCIHALSAMTTFLTAFSHGVSAQRLGLGKQDDVAYVQCPDPGPPCTGGGTVLFKLERM
ncbi:hypothetical protein AKJ44_01455 [candidate division MSBL1 archaeon SCGC-AAA261F17]|uniref:TIGR04076 family protein n=1 Tax=candidate division MSBL1 archaeon SCGC-AAA261F17 TaxID=1698274 RepID=A0A133V6L9_9EURY|nr:hypothetical protein AKJ44_01455 [candidate division MSBL1 archaeon SCGC-AAA261F17]